MMLHLREMWEGQRAVLCGGSAALREWMRALLEALGAQVECLAEESGGAWRVEALREALVRGQVRAWICLEPPASESPQALQSALQLLSASLTTAMSWGVGGALLLLGDGAYRNADAPWACREGDPLGGRDAIGCAEACLRLLAEGYRHGFFTDPLPVVVAHHGALLYGGMPADAPDLPTEAPVGLWLDALERGEMPAPAFPDASAPFQHALEPLAGALLALGRTITHATHPGDTWNFGAPPQNWRSHRLACRTLAEAYGKAFPGESARPQARHAFPVQTEAPRLDSEKARLRLGWRTVYDGEESLRLMAAWHTLAAKEGEAAARATQLRRYFEDLAMICD